MLTVWLDMNSDDHLTIEDHDGRVRNVPYSQILRPDESPMVIVTDSLPTQDARFVAELGTPIPCKIVNPTNHISN